MNDKEGDWSGQQRRVDNYARLIEKIFNKAIIEFIRLGYSVDHNPDKPFSFSDYPGTTIRVNRLMKQILKDTTFVINRGTKTSWEYANDSNDKLVDSILKTLDLPKDVVAKYKNRNLDSLKTFQDRKVNGMNLSDRVWNLTNQFKGELEMAIDLGIAEGKSASMLSLDVRGYLNKPDALFRRVRDKRGILHLSKAAKNYHPGAGVYRSAYKNAMRLTRTELNMGFRDADYQRWQQLDFVVGFEVKRSNNSVPCPICDAFVGRYPKTYKFVGNHPHCKCMCISILASREERDAFTQRVLDGENPVMNSQYEVKQMPQGWKDYVNDNKKRILRAKQPPYWVKDNFNKGSISGGLRFM